MAKDYSGPSWKTKGNWKNSPKSKSSSSSAPKPRSKPAKSEARSAPVPRPKPAKPPAKTRMAQDTDKTPGRGSVKAGGKDQSRIASSGGNARSASKRAPGGVQVSKREYKGSGPGRKPTGATSRTDKDPRNKSDESMKSARQRLQESRRAKASVATATPASATPKPRKRGLDKDPSNKGDESMKAARAKMASGGRPPKPKASTSKQKGGVTKLATPYQDTIRKAQKQASK